MSDWTATLAWDSKRTLRDVASLTVMGTWVVVILIGERSGLSIGYSYPLATICIPVAIAWNWGEDLNRGRLFQAAIGRSSFHMILGARIVTWLALLCLALVPLLFLSDFRIVALQVTLYLFQLVCLGFFLATLLRSPGAGWAPAFAAFICFLAIIASMKAGYDQLPPVWIRALSVIVLPNVAAQWYEPSIIAVTHAIMSVIWVGGAVFAVDRAKRNLS